jgi:hypothetical protein
LGRRGRSGTGRASRGAGDRHGIAQFHANVPGRSGTVQRVSPKRNEHDGDVAGQSGA